MDWKQSIASLSSGVKPALLNSESLSLESSTLPADHPERHNGDYIEKLATAVSTVKKGGSPKSFFLTTLEHDEVLKKKLAEIADVVPSGLNIRQGRGALSGLNSSSFPNKKIEQIANSIIWREMDDLLSDLLTIKVDFATMGSRFRLKPPESLDPFTGEATGTGDKVSTVKKTEQPPATPPATPPVGNKTTTGADDSSDLDGDAEFQDRLNKAWMKWEFGSIIEELAMDWFSTDTCVLFWQMDKSGQSGVGGEQKTKLSTAIKNNRAAKGTSGAGEASGGSGEPVIDQLLAEKQELIPGLLDICTLSPAEVDYDNSLGVEVMRIIIPDALRDRIKQATQSQDKKAKLLAELQAEGVDQKYIDAVTAGQNYVELSNDDGEYWIVCTKNRRHRGLAVPSMRTIFSALETRQAFVEGEFVGAWSIKHHIMHIKAGESIQTGPLAGSQQNWAGQTDTDTFLQLFGKPVKAHKIATNHTVTVEFIFPPKELFDEAKYKKCEQRILNWSGITMSVSEGTGGTYSSGFLGIKKTIASISKGRHKVSHVISSFFDHPSIKPAMNPPNDSLIIVAYDENALKDGKQLLEEINTLIAAEWIDPDTALRSLGHDTNSIRSSRLRAITENKNTGVWGPIDFTKVKQQPGDSTGGKNNPEGRPANQNTDANDPVKNDRPVAQ